MKRKSTRPLHTAGALYAKGFVLAVGMKLALVALCLALVYLSPRWAAKPSALPLPGNKMVFHLQTPSAENENNKNNKMDTKPESAADVKPAVVPQKQERKSNIKYIKDAPNIQNVPKANETNPPSETNKPPAAKNVIEETLAEANIEPKFQPTAEVPTPRAMLALGQGIAAQQPMPPYPPRAQQAGQQGSVLVHFTVSPSGTVTGVRLAEKSRWPMLNRAAVAAIKRWNLGPGRAGLYALPIQFKLH